MCLYVCLNLICSLILDADKSQYYLLIYHYSFYFHTRYPEPKMITAYRELTAQFWSERHHQLLREAKEEGSVLWSLLTVAEQKCLLTVTQKCVHGQLVIFVGMVLPPPV